MTAKTYNQLINQANSTLADNVSRDVSAADVRDMHVDHLDSQNAGTILVVVEQGNPLPAAGAVGRLFFDTVFNSLNIDDGSFFIPIVVSFNGRPGPAILPAANDYSSDQLSDVTVVTPATDDILVFNGSIFVNQARNWIEDANNDWTPKTTGLGIGSANASPAFITVGDVAADGLEGIMAQRLDANGGGILIAGFRGNPTFDPEPNAPVDIRGSAVVIDGTIFMEVPSPVTEDHFLITKPSITLTDGREVVPVVLGPTFAPTTSETQTDNRDVAITPAATEIVIIGVGSQNGALVLANAYAAGSTVNLALVIEETEGRSAIITITVKVNLVDVFQDIINLQGNRFNYFISQPTTGALNISDSITLHVDYINGQGGGSRTVSVRGDVVVSTIEVEST